MNLPNGLTLARIFAVPLLVAVLLTPKMAHVDRRDYFSGGLSLTDLLDGYMAESVVR